MGFLLVFAALVVQWAALPWCAAVSEVTKVRVSVSGQSAGASMAINHLFAFSATVDGCTIAAGNPYGCGNLTKNVSRCYYGSISDQDLDALAAYIKRRAEAGLIDSPSNLKATPVLLFSGKKDWIVWQNVMKSTEVQLHRYINASKVNSRFNTDAAHVWSIDHRGGSP